MTDRRKAPLIVIDPGHGSIADVWRADPGTVDPARGIKESEANLATAVTLAYLLKEAGYRVRLTRTDERNPGYDARTEDHGQVLLISVHYDAHNIPTPRRGVFYRSEQGRPKINESSKIAKAFAKALGDGWVRPTTARGRLYIDNAGAFPAVLVEFDRITDYQDTKEYRIKRTSPLVEVIKGLIPLKEK